VLYGVNMQVWKIERTLECDSKLVSGFNVESARIVQLRVLSIIFLSFSIRVLFSVLY
jgi:hypothetical protein